MRKSQTPLLLALLLTLSACTVIISESTIKYVKLGQNKVAIIIEDECQDDAPAKHHRHRNNDANIQALATLYSQAHGDSQFTSYTLASETLASNVAAKSIPSTVSTQTGPSTTVPKIVSTNPTAIASNPNPTPTIVSGNPSVTPLPTTTTSSGEGSSPSPFPTLVAAPKPSSPTTITSSSSSPSLTSSKTGATSTFVTSGSSKVSSNPSVSSTYNVNPIISTTSENEGTSVKPAPKANDFSAFVSSTAKTTPQDLPLVIKNFLASANPKPETPAEGSGQIKITSVPSPSTTSTSTTGSSQPVVSTVASTRPATTIRAPLSFSPSLTQGF